MLADGGPSSTADMSSDSTNNVPTQSSQPGQDDTIENTGGPPGMLSSCPSPQQQVSTALVEYRSGSSPALGEYRSPGSTGLVEYSRSGASTTLVEYQHGHDPPDTKEGIEELCPVCGDKVSGYHYGLLTCESCKGFFKRTVQNKKVYTCVADRGCHIDKSQRKRCPYCRFQKCIDVGMKLEAVRADRMRGGRNKFGPMYKRDRARKLQMMRQKQIARAQCQGVMTNEVVPVGPPPFPPPAITYDPHVKQELIQIPQLSSSTSSPDSSPSPLCTAAQTNSKIGAHFALAGSQGLLALDCSPHMKLGGSWGSSRDQSPAATSNGHGPSSPKSPYHFGEMGPMPLSGAQGALFVGNGKVPALIKEFMLCIPDDKDWQAQLYGLLQDQSYNQCEVDTFELMCKVIDQSLFGQVDWARNSIFFKEINVDDQMKLLQQSWSDMLILDHMHQRMHAGLPEEVTLPNGQKFNLVLLSLLGVSDMTDQLNMVSARLQQLKFDPADYICLKFLLLLNPGELRTLANFKMVEEAYERTQQALLEYTLIFYPQVTDKFSHLLAILPDIHVMSERGEDNLLYRHLNGNAPLQTLLMEMLHARKK